MDNKQPRIRITNIRGNAATFPKINRVVVSKDMLSFIDEKGQTKVYPLIHVLEFEVSGIDITYSL